MEPPCDSKPRHEVKCNEEVKRLQTYINRKCYFNIVCIFDDGIFQRLVSEPSTGKYVSTKFKSKAKKAKKVKIGQLYLI